MSKLNIFILALIVVGQIACSKKDIVIQDFEGDSFGGWAAEGDAFGVQPAGGALKNQNFVDGFAGNGFANSFHGGDDSFGILISPEFMIERDYVNFLIGGGTHDGTYMELLIDGERIYITRPVVETESLHWSSWDVKSYRGKKAVIRVVDNQQGGWGHIMVDQVEMANKAKSNIMMDYGQSFDINKKYLLIPIEDKGPESRIRLVIDGEAADHLLYIRVAQTKIDYWVSMPVEQFKGKKLTLQFHHVKNTDIGYSQIKQSDTFDFDYNETYRPIYHFSPYTGWTNDPNGMVYHNGEYHLFYQHNPYGSMWANMHWGHATSKDLVNWEHQPEALAPDYLGSIFSGSAVIDKDNTAGFGKDALIAVYTSAGERQTQSIAYSLDNGKTFTKYENNPVLADPDIIDFRDPKVFWHTAGKQWIMSLATTQTITFYGSKNLKQWERLSEFGEGIGNHNGVWECPDLFPLTTPDGKTKWVLLVSINPGGPNGGSATQYFIGDFDGKTFTADPLPYPLWVDYGRDNYAGVTWDNAPGGRRVFIGWMSNWDYANQVPTTNFRNAMTLPRELSLKNNGRHLVLASNPVAEVSQMRGAVVTHPIQRIETSEKAIENLFDSNNNTFELEMTIVPNGSTIFGFGFTNTVGDYLNFTFDNEIGKLMIDRREAGVQDFRDNFASVMVAPLLKKEEYDVRLFFDKASVEFFVNDGEIVMTSLVFPREVFNRMTFFGPKNNWTAKDIKVYPIVK